MRLRLFLFCCLGMTLQAQPDWNSLLHQVREKVKQTVDRLPNYMCTETIDRMQYDPEPGHAVPSCDKLIEKKEKRRPSTSDRLRLDVAMSEHREMFSWVGANHFDDRDLNELVKEGAMSTGSFATFLMAIFAGDSALFDYNGEKNDGGRTLAEFSFRVPLEKSEYVFIARNGRSLTAYEGTFLVDPKTFDLVRLVIHTTGLAPTSGSCQAETTLGYSHVQLRGTDFILPSEAGLRIISSDGVESRNHTVFSACHEFLGESTVSFDVPTDSAASATANQATSKGAAIPAGLSVQLALAQDIDTSAAAVGDPVRAKLTAPIRDRSSRILAPQGAVISGRILEMRHFFVPAPSLSVVLKLETLNTAGVERPFLATLDTIGQRVSTNHGSKGVLRWRAAPGTLGILFDDAKQDFIIKAGQEMKWVTAPQSQAIPESTTPSRLPAVTEQVSPSFQLPDVAPGGSGGASPAFLPPDAVARAGPQNLDFKDGSPGSVPPGWFVPGRLLLAGYSAQLRIDGCKEGAACAVVAVPPNQPADTSGNLMQTFDATPYRGKVVRLHAWLRLERIAPGDRAQMWLRVDRGNGRIGFFENMDRNPVRTSEWKECEIKGRVDQDASRINFGVMSIGKGRAWIDSVSFEVVPR